MIDPNMIRRPPHYSVRDLQLWYASLAEQTMRLLLESGSNIEVLDFGSMFKYHLDVETDDNGHTWPNYSYRRGSIAVDNQDDQQLQQCESAATPQVHGSSVTSAVTTML